MSDRARSHADMVVATRRQVVLGGAGLLGLGASLDRLALRVPPGDPAEAPSTGDMVEFFGAHQAGIGTSAQDYLHFAAFDVTSSAVSDLRDLLGQWTEAAAKLTAGRPYSPASTGLRDEPVDTGEALGLGPSRLTLTFGFGPGLFGGRGADRLGLTALRPPELQALPPFPGENLDSSTSGGDLCVQACADDPQVAFHAIHVLSRLAKRTATLRWIQQGFGRTSSTSRAQSTPRNLMGFKDGTENIRGEDTTMMNRDVWVNRTDQPEWMVDGTYLIARRIRILLDVWDPSPLEEQQRVIGRQKLSGAPLGSQHEYDPAELQATNSNGEPTIPTNAHIRLASAQNNAGKKILRRGYSYTEGIEPTTGALNAGLFFIAFQRSPQQQFIPIQHRLAASDALNQHTLHTASAIFACPPGAKPGGFLGEGLFA